MAAILDSVTLEVNALSWTSHEGGARALRLDRSTVQIARPPRRSNTGRCGVTLPQECTKPTDLRCSAQWEAWTKSLLYHACCW